MEKHKTIIALIIVIANLLGTAYALAEEDYIIPTNSAQTDYTYRCWAGSTLDEGKLILKANSVGGCFTMYNVNIPVDGKYIVSALVGSANSHTLRLQIKSSSVASEKHMSSGGYTSYAEETIGVFDLSSGSAEINLRVDLDSQYDSVYVKELKFTELKAPEVSEINVAGTDRPEIVPRGTDSFEAVFQNSLQEGEIDSCKLLSATGKEIKLKSIAQNRKLSICLLETLDYETEYTLTISGVIDKYDGIMTDDEIYTFTTADMSSDDGKAEFKDIVPESEHENITVKGRVISSNGYGIKNRNVIMNICADGTDSVYEAGNALSGDNGEFTVTGVMPENSGNGKYNVTVKTDYSDDYIYSIEYFTREFETDLLGSIEAAADSDTVKGILSDNASTLSISLTKDIILFKDKNSFYNHFIGIKCSDVFDFRQKYYMYLYLEKINQAAKDANVKAIISDETASEILGVDYGYYSNISDKTGFTKEIFDLDIINDIDEFIEKYEETGDRYISLQCGIEDIEPQLKANNVYVGQKSEIGFFMPETDRVKSLIIDVAYDKALNAELKSEFEFKKEDTDNGVKLILELEEPQTVSGQLFTLSFVAPEAGSYNASVDGRIYRRPIEDWDRIIDKNITAKECAAQVKENSARGETVTTTRGGGGGGGGAKPPVIKPDETNDQNQTEQGQAAAEEYKFEDLDGFEWAAEGVYGLLKKGIISKNDDKKFRPSDNITRAEFIKLIVASMGIYDETAQTDLKDAVKNEWYYPYIASAVKHNIIKGDDNGNCNPESNITRQDMAVIIARAVALKSVGEADKFADDDVIGDYAKDAVYKLRGLGIMIGTDNKFMPLENAARCEAAKVIWMVLQSE